MDVSPLSPLSLGYVAFRFAYVRLGGPLFPLVPSPLRTNHLAIDGPMLLEYGEEQLDGLGRLPVHQMRCQSSAVRIFQIRQ